MKTTAADFAEFQRLFVEYAGAFELGSWKIYFEHLSDKTRNGWSCVPCLDDRQATVGLAKSVDSDIRYIAKHEAIEVLVSRLCLMAESRFVTQEQIEDERHALVRVIENLIP